MGRITYPALPPVMRSAQIVDARGHMTPEFWRLLNALRTRLDPPRDYDSDAQWIALPGGLLVQWGEVRVALDDIQSGVIYGGPEGVTFPVEFAATPIVVQLQALGGLPASQQHHAEVRNRSATGFDAYAQRPAQAGEDETTGEEAALIWHAFGRAE